MADALRERLTRQQVKQALANNQDLVNKDCSGLDLSGLTFKGTNLTNSDFSGTTNRRTRYESCFSERDTNFSGASFYSSVVRDMVAPHSNWSRATFEDTPVVGNKFPYANFEHATNVRPKQREPERQGSLWDRVKQWRDRIWDGIERLRDRVDDTRQGVKNTVADIKTEFVSGFRAARDFVIGVPNRSQIERQNAERVGALHEAMRAAGWDGQRGSESYFTSQKEVEKRHDALIQSGRYSPRQIDKGVRLFHTIRDGLLRENTEKAEISNNDFRHANFSHARFENVRMRHNEFTGAILDNTILPENARTANRFSAPDQRQQGKLSTEQKRPTQSRKSGTQSAGRSNSPSLRRTWATFRRKKRYSREWAARSGFGKRSI